ncbi:MAG TPA: FtsW/RodA/SpoVE family cell cycle protein [Solirubrobacteraceae bacterium]|jgi:rod shape determining protein RodA|nr:FtsW/RodA/SpoVE family cell cycle protein [Solirubrobacteraceae bacterium]
MPAPLSPITAPEPSRRAQAGQPEPRTGPRLMLDPLLTLAVLGLGLCSVKILGSVTSEAVAGQPNYYSERQGIYLVIGAALMLVVARIDYARLRQFKYWIYGALLLSIVAVLGLGHGANGSVRAISFPLFSFQGSELGKVFLILALAALVVDRSRHLGERETTARVMLAALVPAMFVIAQPDLGSGLVYVAIAVTVLFVAGVPWRHLAGLVALGAVALALVLGAAPAVGVHVLKHYEVERLTAFLDPSKDYNSEQAGYQQQESKIAIGAGQKTGTGANDTQIKGNYVPENNTDFVFASIGSRYGFAGAALVLSLYALLIWRTLRILTLSKDLFGALVAGGVAAMLMFQVFVNVGVSIGIMPVTGVTLPLMSYGGSSVIATLLAVGLLQSIYVQARAAEALKGRVLRP